MQLPKLIRCAYRHPAQGVVEYALVVGVLLLAFIVGAAAISGGENEYFTFLGPKLAPTAPSFSPLPTGAPTLSGTPGTPPPTSTPTPLVTPTPIQTATGGSHDTTTTLDCGPTSVTVTSAGPYSTTCTATITATQGGNISGTVEFFEYPAMGAYFVFGTYPTGTPASGCTLIPQAQRLSTCKITYVTNVAGSRTLTAYYPTNGGFSSSFGSVTLSVSFIRPPGGSVSCSYQGQPAALVVGASAICYVTINDTTGGAAPTGSVSWTATPSSSGGSGIFSATTCSLGPGSTSSDSTCQVVFTPTNITSPTGFSFTITAAYGGDATHSTVSPSTTLAVGPAATSTQTFDVSLQSGQTSVDLSAFVDVNLPSTIPPSAINSGTVTFTISQNSTTYCTSAAVTLVGGTASATCTVPANLAPGSYVITASYSGANNFAASAGTALLAVGLIDTTTTAQAASAAFGAPSVVLNATVVEDYPAVGQVNQGTVSFVVTGSTGSQICSTAPATVVPNADLTTSTATATCTIPNGTPIGTYTITPSYSGGANYNPSTSPPSSAVTATLSIIRRTTTVSVTCAPSTLNAGATTSCTATVADGDVGTRTSPTGSVTWSTNGGGIFAISTCTLAGSGTSTTCQVQYTPTDGGTQTLAAYYAGDATHLGSFATTDLTVHRTTATAVVCSPNPTDLGVVTTCTATVTDTSPVGTVGTPSGTVTWSVAPAGAGTFAASASCTLSGGGTCSVGFTPSLIGSPVITAIYQGAGVYQATAPSSTGSTTLTVNKRTTSTAVSCTPNPDNVGTTATCTATVTDVDAGTGSTPTGTVTWTTNSTGTLTGSPCTLSAVNGTTASCPVSYKPTIDGPHTLTATYSGDATTHAPSSGSGDLAAVLGTTTTISCTPTPDAINAPTTCRVTVLGDGSTKPTGSVSWTTDTGPATQFTTMSCTLDASATCTVIYTPGSFGNSNINTLTANYPGDTRYLPSSGTLALSVTKRTTSVTVVSCTPNPIGVSGGNVTCTATVTDTDRGTTTTPGGTVTWSASGGSFTSATCTLAGGSCSVTYVPPSVPGPYTISATYSGDALHLPSASPGYTLLVARPTTTSISCTLSTDPVGTPVSCTVTVTDSGGGGHITPTGSVTWSVSPGGSGTFSAGTCVLAGNGASSSCSISYTPITIGTQTITATYPGDNFHFGSSGTFALTSAPRLVVVASTTTTVAGSPFSVTVTAQDQFGNAYTSYTGTVHFTSTDAQAVAGNGLPSNYTFVAGDNGTHTFVNGVTLKTAGNRTVTATDTVTGMTGTTASISVTAAPASKLVVAAPASATAGTPISVTVTAQDPYSNTATGYPGTVHFTSTDIQAGLPADYTFVAGDNGVHVFSGGVTLKTAGGQTVTATDTVTSSITGTSGTITVNPAAASKLVFVQQPTDTVSTLAISPAVTVKVLDSFGNTVTGSTASITIAIGTNPSAGTLSGTRTLNAVAGIATFNTLSIDKAGASYTLSATSGTLTSATSTTFTISVGAASKLVFGTQPTTTVAGMSVTPAVQVTVQDAGGNTVTSNTASITLAIATNPGAGTLSGTVTLNAVAGVATFSNLSINKVGTGYTLAASSIGLTGATSSTFNITPGAASVLAFTIQPTTTVAGASITPAIKVTVLDSFGNTVTGSAAPITLAIGTNPGSGTLSGTVTQNAVAGVATFSNLSINKTGTGYTLAASSAGLTGATSSTFNITPGPANKLAFSQQPTDTLATATVSPAVTVTVQDSLGNTVTTSAASITMVMGTNPGGGTLSGTLIRSAVGGVATFNNLSIDKVGVGYTLTVSSPALTGTTSSGFTISVGPATRLAFSTQPSNTVAGVNISPAVVVTVQDAGGNTVTSSSALISLAIGNNPGGTTLGGTIVANAVNGVASFGSLSITRTGVGYTLTSASTGLTSATSSSFNITPAAASQFVISAPSTTTAGASLSVTVTAQDQYANTATGYTGTVHFTSTDGQAGLPANYTFVVGDNGTHIFGVTLKTVGSQTVTATDINTASLTATTNSITVTPATAFTLLVADYPATTAADTANTFSVTARDAFGNTATAYTGTVHFTSSDSQSALPGNATLTNGTGIFTATLRTAGTQSITATDTVTGSITGTQGGITVTPLDASTLLAVASTGATTAGSPINVTVTARDLFGNTATGYTGTVSFTSTDGQATLPANYTFVAGDDGTHIFSVTLKTVGSQTVTATDTVTASLTATTNPIAVSAGTATTLLVTGYPSSTAAGTANTFSVTARDAFGNTATGYSGTVHFTSSDSQANLPANATLTNGTATFSATLKTAGTQSIAATDVTTGSITGTQGNITVTPLGASKLLVVASAGTTAAGSPIGVTVTAQDQYGNTAAGYTGTIHFTSPDGLATLPADYTFAAGDNSTQTFTNGVTLRTAGSQTVTAADTMPGPITITGTTSPISVTSLGATTLTVVASTGTTTAGSAFGATVTAKDQFGNTATGYTGTVKFTSTDSVATLPANYTYVAGDNGMHTFSITLKTVGAWTVTATDTVTGTITGTTNPITVNPGTVTTLLVAGYPATTAAGTANPFSVTARDAFGNTVTGYAGTVRFTSSDGQAVLPANATLTNGTGSFSATLKTAGTQSITATDTVTGSITGTESNIAVIGLGTSKFLVVASASSTTAGSALGVTVTAQDQFGNTTTGYTGTVNFTSTDGQATLPATYTFVVSDNGVHTFTNGVTLKTAGPQTVTATDTVTGTITGTSATITVTSASASTLSVVASTGTTTAGSPMTVTVTAKDQFGNTATGYTGTVHFTSTDTQATAGAGLPANYTFVALNAGIHTFSVTLKTVGSQTVTATDTVTTSITGATNAINVTAATASTLVLSGYPPSTTAGVSHSLTVTARDAFGNTATGYTGTVHFTSTDTQATVGAGLPANYTFVALDAGIHTFSVTLKTVGSQTVTATDTGSPSITGTTNPITVTSAAATTLSVVASTGSTTAGTPISVTVTARDAFGNTATGYTGTVHFTSTDAQALAGAGLPANYTFVAGDNGLHTFTNGVTLKTAGSRTVTASDTVTTTLTGTTNAITVTPGAVSATASTVVASPTSVPAGATTATITVTLVDAFGNPVSGKLVTLNQNNPGGSTITPASATATTDSAGHAVFTVSNTHTNRTVTFTATDTTDTITISPSVATVVFT